MVEEHSKRVDGFSEVVVYCDSNRVWCMGEQMDHPKVYYTCLLYTSDAADE